MNIQERSEKLNRITELEKEIAAIKQELEGRPTHVKVPLKAFYLDRYPNLENVDDQTMQRLVLWLEAEIVDNLFISVQL